MNERRGSRAAGLIGTVKKLDVDADGEASGPFLHARVAIEIDKPLRRGVMLKTECNAKPDWFDIQFEKLPFYYYSCGIMGHTGLEYPNRLLGMRRGSSPMKSSLVHLRIKIRNPLALDRRPLSLLGVPRLMLTGQGINPVLGTHRRAKRFYRGGKW